VEVERAVALERAAALFLWHDAHQGN
jgi:hypothetical protein